MSTGAPADRARVATSTDAVHAGEPKVKAFDAVPTAIAQTATYVFSSSEEIAELFEGRHARAREEYGRYGNPTCRALEDRMAALEGAEDALFFATGMSAITTTLLALVKSGDHVVLFKDGYRMTRRFTAEMLQKFGVSCTILDACDVGALAGAIKKETRAVVTESPTNPYLRCIDLDKLVLACKPHRAAKVIVDATFATPVNVRPLAYGVDLVVHSATKYLAGHNDVLGGFVCGNRGLVSVIRDARGMLGGVGDPHAAFLVARGMKTLALRVAKQNENALAVARALEGRKEIARVHYPGLSSHPDHEVARAQMKGAGGVVSFVVHGGYEAAKRAVDRMQIARIAPSLGGVETLVEQPALMSYHELDKDQRAALGIEDGLVRLAVGIEDADDLVRDVLQAIANPP